MHLRRIIPIIVFVAISPFPLEAANDQPNIILINLDDADVEMMSPPQILARYPYLSQFVNDGLRFTNFHVTTPLCGPSRACLLRAQYASRINIRVNNPQHPRSNGFDGGMRQYLEQGYFQDDLSVWMKNAGYHNVMIGKFLHAQVVNYVPPGWDEFYSAQGGNYFGAHRFTNRDHPAGRAETFPLSTYRTSIETEDAVRLIHEHADRASDEPLFMYINPLAPHDPAGATAHLGMIEPRYQNWWSNARMPMTADFNELNVLDKTTVLSTQPLLSDQLIDEMMERYRNRILSVKSVDDMFAEIMATLAQRDMLDNTYVFLTSDNGFSLGHHRIVGKGDSFERSTKVPMYVIGPGVPRGVSANHLLANIDIAPTIVDLAGGQVPAFVDGRSFKQLLTDPASVPEHQWRDGLLIENWQSKSFRGRLINVGAKAVRRFDSIYVRWADGTPEFYDLAIDPLQLFNRYESLSDLDKTYYENYLRLLAIDPSAPQTTISHPFEVDTLLPKNVELFGFAEDDSGIHRVMLTIVNYETGQYWNGASWQTTRVRVPAQLENPGSQLTTWKLTNTPQSENSSQRIGVWARSYDTDGNYHLTLPWTMFRRDLDRPESQILDPADGSAHTQPPLLMGTASDERPLSEMRIVIKEVNSQRFWDGSQWKTQWCYVTTPYQNVADKWQYQMPSSVSGVANYFVAVRAVDDSGNVQSQPTKIRFRVTN